MTSEMEFDLDIDKRDHAVSILESFGCLRKEELRCDLTIKVGKNELKVNRELMIVASGYIRATFAHDTLEKQTGVVNMKDVEFEFVKKCVDFIYTGKISISLEKCEDLLYVACLMQLWSLREYIGLFLKKHLTTGSYFNIRRIAVKFSIENLTEFCNEFAYNNMDMIKDEREFTELDADSVLSVFNVKKSTSTGGEDTKVLSILKWIKFDTENRREHLVKMLESVDLKYVSKSYGRYLVENEPLCYQSADCTRMFYLATMDDLGVKRRKVDSQPTRGPNAIVIFDTKSKALQAYKPLSRIWTKMHNLHSAMVGNSYTAIFVRRYLFVLMGNKIVFRLTVAENDSKWTRMKDMLCDHGSKITATALEDFIYVAGNNTMERYNLRQDCWQMMDTEGISLNSCALVAHGDSVYCIGPGAHSYVFKEVKKSLESVRWNPITPLQVGGEIYSAMSYNGLIYANGGSISGDYCYNPITNSNTWTRIAPQFNYYKSLVVAGGSLFTIASYQGFGRRSSIYIFNSQTQQWGASSSLPTEDITSRASVSVLLPE